MRIQVISRDNGAGLTKDVQVVREAFPDSVVDFTKWDKPRTSGRWDVNIHLELVNPAHLPSAMNNVLVPNPEWFETSWIKSLDRFDMVIAKTRSTEAVFSALHRNVVYTGWTTPYLDCEVDYSVPRMVHVAGKSIMKGTPQVVEAMRLVPDLSLDLVVDKPLKGLPPNIRQHHQPSNEQLCELRRAPIHVQPSTYEGFGHVLNEARMAGAVLVSTLGDTGCEIAGQDYSILCPTAGKRRKALVMECLPDVPSLADCLRIAHDHLFTHGREWGGRAKRAYQQDRDEFHERIRAAIR